MDKTNASQEKKVPSSISQVAIITKYTFIDFFRARRFYILLTIALLISAILTIVVAWRRPPSFVESGPLAFYSSWWGNSTTFVVILSGIFFGGDAISGEFQNKTGYFGIPNPIKRSAIYVGKWISAFTASTIILAIYTIITIVNGLYYFPGNVPYQFGESILFAWFYLAAVLGFTFFFSSLFKSSTMSILVTTILFLFAFSLIETLVAALVQIEPWFILTYGAAIIGNILMVPYPNHTSTIGAGRFSLTTYNASVPEGLLIIGVYFAVTIVLGLLFFGRKEFT